MPLHEVFYLGLSPHSPYYADENRRYRSFLESLATFARGFLVAALAPTSMRSFPSEPRLVVFCGSTYNQIVALSPIASRMQHSVLLGLGLRHGHFVSDFNAYLLSLSSLYPVFRYCRRLEGRELLVARHQFSEFLLAQGYIRLCEQLLRTLRPRVVVLANDHSMRPVVMRLACERLGIPTAYVQHGSVNSRFPPLHFTVSFLDGRDAAEKYDQATDSRPTAFLTGMAKSDHARLWLLQGHRRKTMRVAVCVTLADDIEQVQEFVLAFEAAYPCFTLVLRPHPQDLRGWETVVEVAVCRDQTSFEFLKTVDAIVSRSSGMILEAALAGIPAVLYGFSDTPDADYYGFAKSGLALPAASAACARHYLATHAHIGLSSGAQQALRHYSATVGTRYDGHVTDLIAETLSQLAQGTLSGAGWVHDEGLLCIKAFRPPDN